MKTCSICNQAKPLEDFSKAKHIKSGYGPYCKPCDNARKQANQKKHDRANPDKYLEKRRVYKKTYREKNPESYSLSEWKNNLRKFSLTVDGYQELLIAQDGRCGICNAEPTTKRLAVDHDRTCCSGNKSCGKCVRGLLCTNCNTALGLLKDDKERFMKALEYLNA